MKTLGLYIHIPFCLRKCNYCDFNSYSTMNHLKEQYVKALIKELEIYKEFVDAVIDTIFIGGGTPTCLPPEYISKIMAACCKWYNIAPNCEITIEANPGTLSLPMLKAIKESGINRLSIGLQSWHNDELVRLGRIHTREQFVENYNTARNLGFENINVDLMFSLPDQDIEKWKNTLCEVVKMSPEHISAYSLIIEENTPLYDDYDAGRLILPDEISDRLMYHMAVEMLAQYGYHNYEISNFSKAGFECRHNLRYWKCEEYIGIGAGAHSYLKDKRFSNIALPQDYIKMIHSGVRPIAECMELTEKEKISEYMILGLRLIKGISREDFFKCFKKDLLSVYGKEIDKFMKLGLMEIDSGRYKLTRKGIDVSNQIFVEFI